MSKLLPDLPGKEVVILTVTYPPGHSGAVHRHNANGFIYVLEGSALRSKINFRRPDLKATSWCSAKRSHVS